MDKRINLMPYRSAFIILDGGPCCRNKMLNAQLGQQLCSHQLALISDTHHIPSQTISLNSIHDSLFFFIKQQNGNRDSCD